MTEEQMKALRRSVEELNRARRRLAKAELYPEMDAVARAFANIAKRLWKAEKEAGAVPPGGPS